MASIRKELLTKASPEAVWDAIRDIGALHTRLVPGFVTDTRLADGEHLHRGMIDERIEVLVRRHPRDVVHPTFDLAQSRRAALDAYRAL